MNKQNQDTLKPIQRFWRLLKLDKKELYYIYLYAIFEGIIALILPLGIQSILSFLGGGRTSSSWWLLVVLVTFGTLLAGILRVMQLTISETLQRRIFTRSSFDFAHRLPKLPIELTNSLQTTDLVNRFFDTLTIQKSIPKMLIDIPAAILQITFGLILISFYHPTFVFFSVLLILLAFILFRLTYRQGLESGLKESKYKYKVATWLFEIARTINTFKLMGNSNLHLRKTDDYVSNYLDYRKKHFQVLMTQYGVMIGFKTLVTLILLVVGGFLVIDNQINIGQFVAAEIVVILILNSIEKLILSLDTIYDCLIALDKLGYVTDLPLEREDGKDFLLPSNVKNVSISLNNVSYQLAHKTILHHINLDIKAGEKVCIVGSNGSGKTTLLRIISGLATEYKGNLSYNGLPAREYSLDSLRKIIGDFSSLEDIFNGSLLENIVCDRPHISLTQVMHIIEMVGLKSWFSSLSDGLNTELLPSGKGLPRSVISKIILTRNFVDLPALITIDDSFRTIEISEMRQIIDYLMNSTATLVVISDDLHFVSKCDQIVILKDATVAAKDSFEHIKQTSYFRDLFAIFK